MINASNHGDSARFTCATCGVALPVEHVALCRQVETSAETEQGSETSIGDCRELGTYCRDCALIASKAVLGFLGITPLPGNADPIGALCCRCHGRVVPPGRAHVAYTVNLLEVTGQSLSVVDEIFFAPVCTTCEPINLGLEAGGAL